MTAHTTCLVFSNGTLALNSTYVSSRHKDDSAAKARDVLCYSVLAFTLSHASIVDASELARKTRKLTEI